MFKLVPFTQKSVISTQIPVIIVPQFDEVVKAWHILLEETTDPLTEQDKDDPE